MDNKQQPISSILWDILKKIQDQEDRSVNEIFIELLLEKLKTYKFTNYINKNSSKEIKNEKIYLMLKKLDERLSKIEKKLETVLFEDDNKQSEEYIPEKFISEELDMVYIQDFIPFDMFDEY